MNHDPLPESGAGVSHELGTRTSDHHGEFSGMALVIFVSLWGDLVLIDGG